MPVLLVHGTRGKLYKRAYLMPLFHCLCSSEADSALREIHEGICGSHVGGHALAYMILRKDIIGHLQGCYGVHAMLLSLPEACPHPAPASGTSRHLDFIMPFA